MRRRVEPEVTVPKASESGPRTEGRESVSRVHVESGKNLYDGLKLVADRDGNPSGFYV